ncbi:PREDICTED: putative methyltransferase DDB_G0268948 [Nelumbo nucifera]|uniref:Methyltransferase DDB_G0268948 n=1 Tax=Nelumbo nucifera TaxID=4432 RepID=A0A1U8ARH6_NELNU|nr:PREDICTED: putative methyltransferase DDB_G0268948 [Nelumbo nucifera]
MAGLFDRQADVYVDARPTYPSEWYSMLAAVTPRRTLAWDVGTGNGQAALGVAEHYEQVIGTDVSEAQLKRAMPHPRVRYVHTPPSISDEEIISVVGGENSVDLVTVAQAVHWFDLPNFYSLVARLLRKPGGVLAIWGYNDCTVNPEFDLVFKRFHDTTLDFWDPRIQHIFDGYSTLSFPFESVGLGSEGKPLMLDMPIETSFDGFIGMVRSWSMVATTKERGVDLLSEEVVKELEIAWGGSELIQTVIYKAFMLAGKVKMVRYLHTPLSISDDELISSLGEENSVDLITVAQAVHWFDLPNFYSLVTRLLKKPGGIVAVWGYNEFAVSPIFDPVLKRFRDTTMQFWDPHIGYVFDDYSTLPSPFESIGLGTEGKPLMLDMQKETSFEGFLGLLRSWSAVTTAKERGIDLLSQGVVKELESSWGGPKLIRTVIYKSFMLAGKVRL